MIPRPLSVLLSGLAVLGVAGLHAVTAYRRNAVNHASYAKIETLPDATERLLTTGKTAEWNKVIPLDDVSPDSISYAIRKGIDILLNQMSERGAALDWASFHSHIFDNPEAGIAQVIIRLDVLS